MAKSKHLFFREKKSRTRTDNRGEVDKITQIVILTTVSIIGAVIGEMFRGNTGAVYGFLGIWCIIGLIALWRRVSKQ